VATSWTSRRMIGSAGFVALLGATLGACATGTGSVNAVAGSSPARTASSVVSRGAGGSPAGGRAVGAPRAGSKPADAPTTTSTPAISGAGSGASTASGAKPEAGPAFSPSELTAVDQQLSQLAKTLNEAQQDLANPEGDNLK
jgi:hypothetical protein